jgi:hypothetical protein
MSGKRDHVTLFRGTDVRVAIRDSFIRDFFRFSDPERSRIDDHGKPFTTDDLRCSLGTCQKLNTLFLVGDPDPFLNPPAAVPIPVPVVFPVAMMSVPAMNLAPMLVMVAISVPSDRNF